MTLPASGNLTMAQVATELSIPLPLSLGDSRVLNLAGKAGLPISMSDLYGKSAYTPMTLTGVDSSAYKSSYKADGTVTAHPSVQVVGGSGGCTFIWAFTSNPNTCVLADNTSQTCSVSHSYTVGSAGSASAVLQCTVKDNTGHTLIVTNVNADLSWDF